MFLKSTTMPKASEEKNFTKRLQTLVWRVSLLLVIVIISWKHEIVGGIAFILAGILYMIRLAITMFMNPPFQWYFFSWSLTIAGPAFLIGILFLMNWFKKKK